MTEKSTLCYGATKQEWAAFDVLMGLTGDLLPVVSNPGAVISPDSKMKEKGKVPSRYNKHRQVAGIKEWTKRTTKPEEIERWMKQPDYGICLQTRNVRALDIDIPDTDTARAVQLCIEQELGFAPPRRFRANSAKCLYAFRIEGEMPKRVIRVKEKAAKEDGTTEPAWLIEFLANGQQFVAAGTHTSGARIEWDWQGYDDFPAITLAQFEKVWKALEKQFAIEPATRGSMRRHGAYVETADSIAVMLVEKGLVLDEGSDGQLFIECPWKDNHSMDSGVTECAYFPRGTNNYKLGHFKCLHAGCAHHSDTDFEDALGLNDGMFDEISDAEAGTEGTIEAPPFDRNKFGQPKATLFNVTQALARPDLLDAMVKYDIYRDEDMIKPKGEKDWRPINDGDLAGLRITLEKKLKFLPVGKEMIRDALNFHGNLHRFDSAIEWYNNLPEWDGVPRIDTFLARYYSAEDTPYATAASRYLWSALAGRTVQPGIKADMTLILQGNQGVIKSTAIAAIAPTDEQFGEIDLADRDDDVARILRGKSVLELGELRGFYSKEFESIKAWLVRRFDEWVPKYKEKCIRYQRRCVFIGTTNHAEFLIDETGNRRFLPIHVEKADIEGLRRDKVQLWAEARVLFTAHGICWQDAENLARGEHEKFMMHDSWEDDVQRWLETDDIAGKKPIDAPFIRTSDVLRDALNIDSRSATSALEKRAARVLTSLGYVVQRVRVEGRQQRVYVKSQKITRKDAA